jgi:hypothetical protein
MQRFLATLVIATALVAASPKSWLVGELVDVTRRGEYYDYRIIYGNDRFTGRSTTQLHLTAGTKVQFSTVVSENSLYLIGEDKNIRKTRYYLQELMPPPPVDKNSSPR